MARLEVRERWSDRELIAAIADRDGEACTVFYRRHLARVVAYLMRETRDPELAADITGEVFATVIVAARRYRPETESAAPWLIGIARNTLAASRRRGRVQDAARRRLEIEPIDFDDDDSGTISTIGATGATGATGARGGRAGTNVADLVAELPSDERHAVEARVVHERSYSDIAAQLHCSEMVVRKRVSRGLGRVRRRLEGGR
jgi:RNA polymerase sigma factor (sigma-70 family)